MKEKQPHNSTRPRRSRPRVAIEFLCISSLVAVLAFIVLLAAPEWHFIGHVRSNYIETHRLYPFGEKDLQSVVWDSASSGFEWFQHRITNIRFHPITSEELAQKFREFTLDIDDPSCLELLVGPKTDQKDARRAWNGPCQAALEIVNAASTVVDGEDKAATDFLSSVGRHVHDLKIEGRKSMVAGFPQSRAELLNAGLAPFISQMPNLVNVTAFLTGEALVSEDWAKLLASLCPPIQTRTNEPNGALPLAPSDTTQEETKGWAFRLHVHFMKDQYDRIFEPVGGDVLRNLQVLSHLETLEVDVEFGGWEKGPKYTFGKQENIDAAVVGFAVAIRNSPGLRSLSLSLGYNVGFRFDDVLDRVQGTEPLALTSLELKYVYGPAKVANAIRLPNLKHLLLWEPAPRRPWNNDKRKFENHSIHKDCTPDGTSDCIWQVLRRLGILLASINVSEVPRCLSHYIRNPSLVGTLKSINLHDVEGYNVEDAEAASRDFWDAISAHVEHIEYLYTAPAYYGGYCWQPDSQAAAVISKMKNLRTLCVCPATELHPGLPVFRNSDRYDEEKSVFVRTFLESIWSHPKLQYVGLHITDLNTERYDNPCDTLAMEHMVAMRSFYEKAIEKSSGIGQPGFKVFISGRYRRNIEWHPVEGCGGRWQMKRISWRTLTLWKLKNLIFRY